MFIDFLGKEAYEGDLVIKSSSNRSSSILMIGVIVGKIIWCLEPDIQYGGRFDTIKKVTKVVNFYKIDNPTALELSIKERILKHISTIKK